MDISRKRNAIFYIDNTKAVFYGSNQQDMLQIDFPPNVVSDLELINKEKLDFLIKQFVEANKIEPTEITFLFSSLATFEKDFSKENTTADDQDIINFLEYVPFETIISRAIKMEKKLKLVVINKELYDAFKLIFEKYGFSIISVLPLSVLQETIPGFEQNLNLQAVLDKTDSLKHYSLLPAKDIQRRENKKRANPQNNKMPVLLGILGFLLAVLIFTMLSANKSESPKPKVMPLPAAIPSPVFTATEEPLSTTAPAPTITFYDPQITPKYPLDKQF